MIYYMVFVFLGHISLGIMPAKSFHVTENGRISFFFMADWHSIVYVCVCVHVYVYNLFIQSFIDGCLVHLHVLAIINKP